MDGRRPSCAHVACLGGPARAGRLVLARRFAKTLSNPCAHVPGATGDEITVTSRAPCESFRVGEKTSREPRAASRELEAGSALARLLFERDECVRREVVMLAMGNVPVFCATTEGQTRRIAAEIAATLREQGFVSDVHCLSEAMPAVNWSDVRGVVVGASIHAGRHQKAAVDFVTREARHLTAVPSAFFSVSLSAASRNPAEVDAARGLATHFARQTGWEPTRVLSIAGKLAYSQVRFRDPTDHAVHRVAGRGSDRHQS